MSHHRLQHQQLPSHSGGGQRSSEKTRRPSAGKGGAAPDLNPIGRGRSSVDRTHREGNSYSRKTTDASLFPLEFNYGSDSSFEFPHEFRQDISKKVGGTPIKTLINEEMSKEVGIRRSSPSLVARLMGLDILSPPQVVPTQQKKVGRSFLKTSSVGLQDKHACCDHSIWVGNEKDEEFKDVFEVVGPVEVHRTKTHPVSKGNSSSKKGEIDLDYIRQKFMDAKRLSTDELRNSEELDETLETLDSNKDLFLKFLQEPNSLFTKHLQDLKCLLPSPSPHVSNITILKSSKGIKHETGEGCPKSERNAERCMQKEVMTSFRKPATRSVRDTLKEHNYSSSHKLAKLQHEGKTEHCPHPTRIVVLKPSLEKSQKMESATSQKMESAIPSTREFQLSGIPEFYAERRERQKLSDNVHDMLRKSKCSKEIAREISKQLGDTVKSSTKKLSSSRINGSNKKKISFLMSGIDNLYNPKACSRSAKQFDDYRNSFSSSSSYSTESSVSRESRKRSSEQRKMAHHFQEAGPTYRGSSTLGEMLALSDREVSKKTLDLFSRRKFPDEKMATDEAISTWGSPTGISSRDGWKEGCSKNMLRSTSLPSSSSVYGCSKPTSTNRIGGKRSCSLIRNVLNHDDTSSVKDKSNINGISSRRSYRYNSHKPHPCNPGAQKSKLPEWEIHVNQEVRSRIHVNHVAEKTPIVSGDAENSVDYSCYLVGDCSVPETKVAKILFADGEEHAEQPKTLEVLVKNPVSACCDHDDTVTEDTSYGHVEVDCLRSDCQLTESVASISSKDSGQPSPISVLELPYEDEKSSSGCFETISADLKELRMQLQLLKMESVDSYADVLEDKIMSDEDAAGECHFPLHNGEILQTYRDEMDRDYSYLVDMLISSGIHGANWAGLSDACHSTDNPIDPTVFDILENKYSRLVSWRRSERKLFFDLINSIVAENMVYSIDLHPWVKSELRFKITSAHEDLIENLWQMLDKHRKKLSSEQEAVLPRWSNLGMDADVIGYDIEAMLTEELLEELVSELI